MGRRTQWGAQDQSSLGGGRAVVRVPVPLKAVGGSSLGPAGAQGSGAGGGRRPAAWSRPLLTQPLQAAPPSSRALAKDRKVPLGSPAWRGSLCSGGPEVPVALRKKRRAQRGGEGVPGPVGEASCSRQRGPPSRQAAGRPASLLLRGRPYL